MQRSSPSILRTVLRPNSCRICNGRVGSLPARWRDFYRCVTQLCEIDIDPQLQLTDCEHGNLAYFVITRFLRHTLHYRSFLRNRPKKIVLLSLLIIAVAVDYCSISSSSIVMQLYSTKRPSASNCSCHCHFDNEQCIRATAIQLTEIDVLFYPANVNL